MRLSGGQGLGHGFFYVERHCSSMSERTIVIRLTQEKHITRPLLWCVTDNGCAGHFVLNITGNRCIGILGLRVGVLPKRRLEDDCKARTWLSSSMTVAWFLPFGFEKTYLLSPPGC